MSRPENQPVSSGPPILQFPTVTRPTSGSLEYRVGQPHTGGGGPTDMSLNERVSTLEEKLKHMPTTVAMWTALFASAAVFSTCMVAYIDAKFDSTDAKFQTVDAKFDSVDKRFNAIDKRFDIVDTKFAETKDDMNKISDDVNSVDDTANKILISLAELKTKLEDKK